LTAGSQLYGKQRVFYQNKLLLTLHAFFLTCRFRIVRSEYSLASYVANVSGRPNLFVRGPHKLSHNSSRAGYLA